MLTKITTPDAESTIADVLAKSAVAHFEGGKEVAIAGREREKFILDTWLQDVIDVIRNRGFIVRDAESLDDPDHDITAVVVCDPVCEDCERPLGECSCVLLPADIPPEVLEALDRCNLAFGGFTGEAADILYRINHETAENADGAILAEHVKAYLQLIEDSQEGYCTECGLPLAENGLCSSSFVGDPCPALVGPSS